MWAAFGLSPPGHKNGVPIPRDEQKELVDREAAQHRALDAEKATRGVVGRGFNPARGGSLPGAARCVII